MTCISKPGDILFHSVDPFVNHGFIINGFSSFKAVENMASERIKIFACEDKNSANNSHQLPELPPIDSPDVAEEIGQLWNLNPTVQVRKRPEDEIESLLSVVHVARNSATNSLSDLAFTATAIQCIVTKTELPSYKCRLHFCETQRKFQKIAVDLSKIAKLRFRELFDDICDFDADNFDEEGAKPMHNKKQLAQLSRQIWNAKQSINCELLDRVIADNIFLGYQL